MPYHSVKMKEGGCGCGCAAKTTSNHPDPFKKKVVLGDNKKHKMKHMKMKPNSKTTDGKKILRINSNSVPKLNPY